MTPRRFGTASLFFPMLAGLAIATVPRPTDAADAADARAREVAGKMTQDEKFRMIGGYNYMETQPIERLGIPAIRMANGRSGVRPWKTPLYPLGVVHEYRRGTCFPAGIALGASWNRGLMAAVGEVIAKECNHKNVRILLGPGVNIARNPYNGRNFEAYGEDPYLSAQMVVPFITSLQQQGVMGTIVMFPCMNQEIGRFGQTLTVSQRALREIYFPAFKAAVVAARVAAVMTSYPKINGAHASENSWLLNTVLRDEWGFEGFTMSDWGAAHDPLHSALGGLDIEMPSGANMNAKKLTPFVMSGKLPMSVIDDKVVRILGTAMRFRAFDGTVARKAAFNTPGHRALARRAAEEGIVLLKNRNNTLPLSRAAIRRLTVIGPSAVIPRLGGGGSSTVPPAHLVTPIEGLRERLKGAAITYTPGFFMRQDIRPIEPAMFSHGDGQPGLKGEYYANPAWEGEPIITRSDSRIAFDWGQEGLAGHPGLRTFSVRWSGTLTPRESGAYVLSCLNSQSFSVRIDGETVIGPKGEKPARQRTRAESIRLAEGAAADRNAVRVELEGGQAYRLEVLFACPDKERKAAAVLGWRRHDENPVEAAVREAKASDAAIVFAGLSRHYEREGRDLETLRLEADQVSLIKAVAAVNPRTIVVLHNGTPLLIDDWVDDVPVLLEAWYPGQEGGAAIARVLLGDVNPSGKLPMTFPRKWEDCPASDTYPPEKAEDLIKYTDDIFVGYRHYDTRGVKPLFPFGFGLSYTSFKYSNLKLSSNRLEGDASLKVTFDVTNIGRRKGGEVAQLYLHDVESSASRPFKELKGFSKVLLEPGETKTVTVKLTKKHLAFWDASQRSWLAEDGVFRVLAGPSSAETALEGEFYYSGDVR